MTLHVQRAIEVIGRVRVPFSITHRPHDKKLALCCRTPNPQHEPQISAFLDCYCVLNFSWDRLELHQSDLGIRRTALAHVLEDAPPARQLLPRQHRRIDSLIPQPSVERLKIVLADELVH